jgi:uncharacterized repeat protein (TIGR03803 family)
MGRTPVCIHSLIPLNGGYGGFPTGTNDGAYPASGLVQGSGGYFYGTTENGGTYSDGTVFIISTNGAYASLYSFNYQYNGDDPEGALVQGSDGNLYGTTSGGGPANQGIVFRLSVTVPTVPQVTTVTLPNGTNGYPYSQQLFALYGQPPYSWSLVSGSLPAGLTLAINGVISGTPTTSGTFNFTVKVTDALSATATQALALTVGSSPSVVWIQPANNLVTVTVGSNVTFAVSVAGTGPFSYQWR